MTTTQPQYFLIDLGERNRVHIITGASLTSERPLVLCGRSAVQADGCIHTAGAGVVTPRCRDCTRLAM